MGQSIPSPQILNAEQEHAALRFAVLLLIGLLFILFSFVIYTWLRGAPEPFASFSLLLTCVLAAVLSLGLSWAIEQRLKQVWTSGYRLLLAEDSLIVEQPEMAPVRFDRGEGFAPLAWFFSLRGYKRGGRERRTPEGWVCLACQLQQEDRLLIVYTYLPPVKAEELMQGNNGRFHFHKLNPAEVYHTGLTSRFQPPSRPESIPPQVLSGKDGRYWLAEQRRWQEGLELPPKEFTLFLNYLS